MRDFPYLYDDLLEQLVHSDHKEVNVRTGQEIKMIPGGHSFKIDMTDQRLPITGTRKLFPHVAAAEIAWFVQGLNTTYFLRKHNCKIWDKFVEADEVTVAAAYGWRWRHGLGRDQLRLAINAMRKNPTDRRIWVQAWDPAQDGLGAPDQKNVPCPVGFTFTLVDNILHSSLFIRSSDVFVGLPYDVMGHAMLMAVVGASVGAHAMGSMHVTLSHAHLYSKHYEMAEACLVQKPLPIGPSLYAWDMDKLLLDPDGFVWTYRKAAQEVEWPSYSPKPELIL